MIKKKIIILGSTGKIGESTLKIIQQDKKKFQIVLLTANSNWKKLLRQAKQFGVKKVLIFNPKSFLDAKKAAKNQSISVYSGKTKLTTVIKSKVDYTMSAISGIAGLKPTLQSISITKNLAIANKESIVCAGQLIKNKTKKFKTNLIPIDSEHFSIYELTKNVKDHEIEEIVITASGGPFLNTPIKKLNNVKPHQAVRHPNWIMGKKISVDSANLMNKVFEIIEASQLFDFNWKKYKILIHPQSYAHSIIKFKSGIIKMVLHDTDMKIPIAKSIYGKFSLSKKNSLNSKKLSDITFFRVDKKKFPSIKFISKCLSRGQSASIILNAANEELVSLFLKNKIKFKDIIKHLTKIFSGKEFLKVVKKKPVSINEIYKIDKWARLKTASISVK